MKIDFFRSTAGYSSGFDDRDFAWKEPRSGVSLGRMG